MEYFILSLIAFSIGFITGLYSKAQAKINKRKSIEDYEVVGDRIRLTEEGTKKAIDEQLKGLNIPGHISAPPPPPPSRVIREGKMPTLEITYMRPGITYDKGTFVNVNKCKSCSVVGYSHDLWYHKPCPKCGGKVREYGVAKWENEEWVMSKA